MKTARHPLPLLFCLAMLWACQNNTPKVSSEIIKETSSIKASPTSVGTDITENFAAGNKEEGPTNQEDIAQVQEPNLTKTEVLDVQKTAPQKPKKRKRAIISFEQTSYDFGEINEGDKITYDFKFTNTGTGPLTINDVAVSCGCTVPSYPIMPIGPGEKGTIGVVYNSKGKFGAQRPFITVKSNATGQLTKLYLNGSIKHVFERTTPVDSSKVSEKSNSQ